MRSLYREAETEGEKTVSTGGMKMTKFECCGLELATEEALAQHRVKAHFEERNVVGSCCGVNFFTQAGLSEHQRTAHDMRRERS